MKIDELVATELREAVPYALDDLLQQEESAGFTKLDLNENLCTDTRLLRSVMRAACFEVNPKQYPLPQGGSAVPAISKHLGVDPSMVYVGNGSDDVLDRLTRTFAKKGSAALIVEPTFVMYRYFVSVSGARTKPVLLTPSFELDVDAIIKASDPSTSLLFLCSPNNPTGNQFKIEDIREILREFTGLVAIDEAYADFGRYSAVKWTQEFENLVVLRSFSKAYGLAALRAGYAVSNPSVIGWLNKATPPFNVNAYTQKLIEVALKKTSSFKKEVSRVVKEREWLMKQLQSIEGIRPYPSDANFILFKIVHNNFTSSELWRKLREKKILVRDKGSDTFLKNCIRVTVGTRSMNLRFLRALKQLLHSG